MLSLVFTIV